MRRLLFLLIGLFLLFWWAYRALVGASRNARASQDGGRVKGGPPAGTMVRDRVCNTFLPRERALTTRLGSEEHFFCSEKCREAFLARRGD
jgi:hypothetical protein